MDIGRQKGLTPEAETVVEDMFQYHAWNEEQQKAGALVRAALASAFKVIVDVVPPSPDRSAAMRMIRDSRMSCNSAITHGGKY